MNESKAELVVIGSGPGGYPAAFLAADMGMDVTLIDPEVNPGGVCLFRGCIPTKTLLHLAKLIREVHESKAWGVSFSPPVIELDKIRSWKNRVVQQLTSGNGKLCSMRGIKTVRGTARFLDGQTLDISTSSEKRTLSFKKAVLATGTRPAMIPGFPDSPRIINSDQALELESIPETLLVIGGGYIGLELGSVFASFGSKVTVVEMMPSILPGADSDLVRMFSMSFRKQVNSILVNTMVKSIEEGPEGLTVQLQENGRVTMQNFDRVLVTVGRIPNTKDLGLEQTRIRLDQKGFVQVDAMRRTDEPSVYAVGDVAGGALLAHKATHEGKTAVMNIAGKNQAFNPKAIPSVLFTDPEVAWCGITENEAAVLEKEVSIGKFMWAASGRAASIGRADGMTKIIADPKTEQVLGIGLVGPGAGELIAEGVLAVENGLKVSDIAHAIHPHPTLSETVMEAAEAYYGLCTHQLRSKRT